MNIILNKKAFKEWQDDVKEVNDEYREIYRISYDGILEREVCKIHMDRFWYNYRTVRGGNYVYKIRDMYICNPKCNICSNSMIEVIEISKNY